MLVNGGEPELDQSEHLVSVGIPLAHNRGHYVSDNSRATGGRAGVTLLLAYGAG